MTASPTDAAKKLLKSAGAGYRLTALHPYTAADGAPLFWRIRADGPDGKWMRPMKLDSGRYQIGEPTFAKGKKPLYRLDVLARRPGEPVFVVEGEKCADALGALGILATTSGSASSADAADWGPLAGRAVTVWPDHDEPGAGYADVVAAKLAPLGCRVRRVDVAALGLAAKGDCADWLAAHAGATAEDVRALACVEERPALAVQRGEGDGTGPDASKGPNVAPGFFVNPQGVFAVRDEGEPIRVCSELHVRAKVRDGAGAAWGRLLEWRDDDGRRHRWAMPLRSLTGDGIEAIRELTDRGLRIARGRNTHARLFDFIENGGGDARARCVSKLGWDGGVFVTPTEAIGATGEEIVFQGEQVPAWDVAGTVEDWRESVARLACGNTRFVFALSVAFAGPLARLASESGGGFHLYGGSSCGKTTALHVAASVWGKPDGYARTWRATGNGLEGIATMHNDGLLILDELSESDPRETGETVYMLANGAGKARANRAGGARPAARWRVLFLSAGEITLSAHMAKAGKKPNAGQEIRFADVPADAGVGRGAVEALNGCADSGAVAKAIKDAADRAHGAAGVEWLRYAVQGREAAERALAQDVPAFVREVVPAGASGQIERVAKRFGLVACAGERATLAGLTGWPEGEAWRAAKACFAAWLDGFGTDGNREERAIKAAVRAFFEAHASSRFEDLDAPPGTRVINRVGYVRGTTGGREWLVFREAFAGEVCKGLDAKTAAKVLVKAGWLVPGGDGRAADKVRVPGEANPIRVYRFTGKLFEGDD